MCYDSISNRGRMRFILRRRSILYKEGMPKGIRNIYELQQKIH